MDERTSSEVGVDEQARAARSALAAWADAHGLRRAQVRGGERWSLPNGTVVAWLFPPAGRRQRGLELNVLHLRTVGHDDVADDVLAGLARLGVDASSPDHPALPYGVLADEPERLAAEVLDPYVAAYEEMDAHRLEPTAG